MDICKAGECRNMVDGIPCDDCIEGELFALRSEEAGSDWHLSRFTNMGRSCHDCGGTRSECDCDERCIRASYAYDARMKREREEARL